MEGQVSEAQARELTYCVGCGGDKHKGLAVCWDCFKYSPNPLKYFHGTFEEWQRQIFQEVA